MRRRSPSLLSLLAALCLSDAARAEAPIPLLEPPRLPGLTDAQRQAHARWLGQNLARAIAFGPNGTYGAAWGRKTLEEARAAALEACRRRTGGAPCALYAVDLAIVAPGREWSPPVRPPETVGIGRAMAWEIVPDQRYLWRGPTAAHGAIVFGHGRGLPDQDNRGQQPQPWVRHVNNAGYDVFRFDRHPGTDDERRAAAWLREGLGQLRALGYRTIVVSGQSRGGWNALQMLSVPGLAEAVIAIAPAAHGSYGSMNLLGQLDQLRRLSAEAANRQARVAVVQFAEDPFMADNAARAAILREVLAPRVSSLLLIDRPEGFFGHHAGGTGQFSERFGPCLVAFVAAPVPPRSC